MRYVLTYYHHEPDWLKAAGLEVPPLGVGARACSWSVLPGLYLPAIHRDARGAVDFGNRRWSEARPVLWDIDAGQMQVSRAAVLASGFYIEAPIGHWRYYEAPGREPIFLAAAGSAKSAALLAWAPGGEAGGLPALVPGEAVRRWVAETGTAADAFVDLPRWSSDLFRSWPVLPPIDRPPLRERNDDSLIAPFLGHERPTRAFYRRRPKIR